MVFYDGVFCYKACAYNIDPMSVFNENIVCSRNALLNVKYSININLYLGLNICFYSVFQTSQSFTGWTGGSLGGLKLFKWCRWTHSCQVFFKFSDYNSRFASEEIKYHSCWFSATQNVLFSKLGSGRKTPNYSPCGLTHLRT